MAQSVRVSDVRSIQRLPLPPGWHAEEATREYLKWLPRFMRPFLKVDVQADGRCQFRVLGIRHPLLELTLSAERSTADRQLLYITGGLLVAGKDGEEKGRLEFREVLGGRALLSAIHGFQPSLPWFLYTISQALVHQFVMLFFGRHLGRLARRQPDLKTLVKVLAAPTEPPTPGVVAPRHEA
jgi:hypothetical protein